jgi:DNA-binding YbaB/EbfC family protein
MNAMKSKISAFCVESQGNGGSLTFLPKTDILRQLPYSTERRAMMRGLPNMQGMMKQLQKMQDNIARVQAELETKTVMGEAGGGMVKVTANGKQQLVKIAMEKEVVNPDDVEMLEDLVLAAANKALEEAGKLAQEEMAKATNGLMPNIPGLSLPGL